MKLTKDDIAWIGIYHRAGISVDALARTWDLSAREVGEIVASQTDSSAPPEEAEHPE